MAVVVLVVCYFGRSWLRTSVTPWFGNIMYGKRVDNEFKASFSDFNRQLAAYNIEATDNSPNEPTCGDGNFKGLRETVICFRTAFPNWQDVTPKLQKDWPAVAPRLEATLAKSGWELNQKDQYTTPVRLSHLRSAPAAGEDEIVYSAYHKKSDGVTCDLSLNYYTTDITMLISESCVHYVDWFGGYRN